MHLAPEAPNATVVAAVSVNDMRERIRRKSRLKGRQPEDAAMAEVAQLLGPRPATGLRRDLLIEYLHRLNDHFGVLHDRHLVALARFGLIEKNTVGRWRFARRPGVNN